MSGYDIMKIFDLSMAHYWHAHPTQIYPTLDRMEEFGLIKRRNVVQRNRPNKRLYTITPSGERLLIEWLESPFEGINLKHPPLLRCRFLGHLGADGAIAVLKEERRSWAIHLKRYREIEKNYFADGKGYRDVNAMFSMFTLRRGIDWMEENIRWCDWAIGEIEKQSRAVSAENMRTQMKPLIAFDPIRHRQVPREKERESIHLIECETRGGFHTSFGRAKPCTLVIKMRHYGLLEGVRGKMSRAPVVLSMAAAASDTSPVISRERRPAGAAAGR